MGGDRECAIPVDTRDEVEEAIQQLIQREKRKPPAVRRGYILVYLILLNEEQHQEEYRRPAEGQERRDDEDTALFQSHVTPRKRKHEELQSEPTSHSSSPVLPDPNLQSSQDPYPDLHSTPADPQEQAPPPVLPQPNLQSSQVPPSSNSSPTPGAYMALAKSQSHPSHQLFHKRGVIYCRVCGLYGTVKFVNLLKPCRKPAKWVGSMGYKNLSKIHRDIPPQPLESWPLNMFESPPSGPV